MKIFRRRKHKDLAPFIMVILIRINRKLMQWGIYLQSKTDKYSKNKKKVYLVVFCLVFLTDSTLVIVDSFQNGNVALYTIAPIRMVPLRNEQTIAPQFTKGEYKRIEQFRLYLDSNAVFRDSMLKVRPHLIDTLIYLQKIYKQNENGK